MSLFLTPLGRIANASNMLPHFKRNLHKLGEHQE
jgi:hypothetical protein